MIYTLGRLELDEPAYRHVKPLLLLVYLCLEGKQERRFVAEVFWAESKSPLNALSALLFRLRRDVPEAVRTDKTFVWSNVTSDAGAFLNAAEQGLNEKALELYRGGFLEGVVAASPPLEEWLYSTRELLSQRAYAAALHVAEGLAARGEVALAAQQAETALTFRNTVALDADSLGRTYRLLEPGKSPKAKVLEAEAQEFDLDLSVYEPAAPMTASSNNTSGNLPKPDSSFIGRGKELEQLATQLADPECRLLTLLGPGGVGKSRLALELARRLDRTLFQDGVVWVALEALTSPELVPTRIADALGITLQSKGEPLQQVISFVQNKQLLLVLDNFEHLLDSFAAVKTLLSAAPTLKLVVTSRVRLNLTGEWVFALEGLPYQDDCQDKVAKGGLADAQALFYQRAQRAHLDFAVTAEDTPYLLELCRLVGGSPLALELAASWVRVMSVEALVQEIRANIAVLSSGHQDKPARHQSMTAVLSQSWQRLPPEEQTFLTRLSVFEGGFTREAAAQVADVSLLMLTRLIDKSLLRKGEKGRYGFHPLMRQFAGQKLSEDEGSQELTKERYTDYFLTFAETAEPELMGPEQTAWLDKIEAEIDNPRTVAHLFLDQGDAEKLFRWISAVSRFWLIRGYITEGRRWLEKAFELNRHKQQPCTLKLKVTALRLAGDLASYQGELETAHRYLREGLAIARELREVASYHDALGKLARAQGDFLTAQKHHEQSLALSEKQDLKGTASSPNNLGLIAYDLGNWSAARCYFKRSLEIRKGLGDKQGATGSVNNLGNIAYRQGKYSEAEHYYQESLILSEELGNQRGTAHALNNLGLIAGQQEDYVSAREYGERSLEIKRKLGEQYSIAVSLMNLGHTVCQQKDFETAERLLSEALSVMRKLDHPLGTASALHDLGVLANERKRGETRAYLAEALELWATSPGVYPAYSLEEFGHLAYISQDYERAVKLWARASALRKQVGEPLPKNDKPRYEKNFEAVRSALCTTAFQAAWGVGEAMTLEEAIDYALRGG